MRPSTTLQSLALYRFHHLRTSKGSTTVTNLIKEVGVRGIIQRETSPAHILVSADNNSEGRRLMAEFRKRLREMEMPGCRDLPFHETFEVKIPVKCYGVEDDAALVRDVKQLASQEVADWVSGCLMGPPMRHVLESDAQIEVNTDDRGPRFLIRKHYALEKEPRSVPIRRLNTSPQWPHNAEPEVLQKGETSDSVNTTANNESTPDEPKPSNITRPSDAPRLSNITRPSDETNPSDANQQIATRYFQDVPGENPNITSPRPAGPPKITHENVADNKESTRPMGKFRDSDVGPRIVFGKGVDRPLINSNAPFVTKSLFTGVITGPPPTNAQTTFYRSILKKKIVRSDDGQPKAEKPAAEEFKAEPPKVEEPNSEEPKAQ
ncbi:hypothetical protein BZA77DRAFT_310024 [Pyronema omphalodes]|nr:hypothetical protein BZA77DRAFT_310024 [Pyronema omphalodes]